MPYEIDPQRSIFSKLTVFDKTANRGDSAIAFPSDLTDGRNYIFASQVSRSSRRRSIFRRRGVLGTMDMKTAPGRHKRQYSDRHGRS